MAFSTPNEDDGSSGGTVDLGWSAYLTVFSREQNINMQGQQRIYINDQDLNNLYTNLSTAVGPDLTNYIMAYRIYGPRRPSAAQYRAKACCLFRC